MKRDYSLAVRLACRTLNLPDPVAEYRFTPPRKFRFDFAWPAVHVALEVDGGTWVRGRHSRGEADHEKMNLAASKGWKVFRTTPQKVGNLALYRLIKEQL